MSQRARRFFANQREDAAIVMRVGMNVEQIRIDSSGQFLEGALVGSFADIDHTFEHPTYLPNSACLPHTVDST